MSENKLYSIISTSTTSRRMINSHSSFTLVELLIVIAILAMLAAAVVLALNPAELLAQARDSVRISEVNTINRAINLFQVNGGTSLGPPNTVHVSLPDTSSTCINHSLPPLPSPWVYACRPAADFRRIDGQGWIPINFSTITGGSPIVTLPVDPVNNATHYYTYITGGSFALSSLLESNRYLRTSSLRDGGTDPGRIELGTNLNLLTRASGLVGYWPLDNNFNDASGNNNNGTGHNFPANPFVPGRQGQAGNFDGVDDFVNVPHSSSLAVTTGLTVEAWVRVPSHTAWQRVLAKSPWPTSDYYIVMHSDGRVAMDIRIGGTTQWGPASVNPLSLNTWHHVVGTYNGSILRFYLNGIEQGTGRALSGSIDNNAGLLSIGRDPNGFSIFNGLIDEVRIYNRALSPAEIQAIFNATR